MARVAAILPRGERIRMKNRHEQLDKKKKEQTMCLETADIIFTKTGSELLALLLESSEIKHIYPN